MAEGVEDGGDAQGGEEEEAVLHPAGPGEEEGQGEEGVAEDLLEPGADHDVLEEGPKLELQLGDDGGVVAAAQEGEEEEPQGKPPRATSPRRTGWRKRRVRASLKSFSRKL